jgi:hypothetical protein
MPITFKLENYISDVYIETGILYGESIQLALNSGFKKIYAIDINPLFVESNRNRYKKEIEEGKLIILEGASTDVLPQILKTIDSKSTFFLDAHDLDYNGIHKSKFDKSYECPVLTEIKIILEHNIKNHIIMIDDIKMIVNNFGWANGYNISLQQIKNKILEINPDYKFDLIEEINGCLICYV